VLLDDSGLRQSQKWDVVAQKGESRRSGNRCVVLRGRIGWREHRSDLHRLRQSAHGRERSLGAEEGVEAGGDFVEGGDGAVAATAGAGDALGEPGVVLAGTFEQHVGRGR
jgi:hypothetical protein